MSRSDSSMARSLGNRRRSPLRANLLNPPASGTPFTTERRTSAAGHPERAAPDGPEGTRPEGDG